MAPFRSKRLTRVLTVYAVISMTTWLTTILILKGHKNLNSIENIITSPRTSSLNFSTQTRFKLRRFNNTDRPGEMGEAVILPSNLSNDIKTLIDEGYKKNAFNQYVSDLISVNRHLPDYRDEWCKAKGRFLNTDELSQTSVIICFHNEAWSVLLRTIHSVLDRSPEHLIKEIILVDDFSYMPYTKTQLEDYWALEPKVKIIRATKREGLIRARLLGAAHATGEVLTYLDSHCECTIGWLEPLLDRIARDPTTVVCPLIETIDDDTLQYHYVNETTVFVGYLDWSLIFDWIPEPERETQRRSHYAEPIRSATMAGGLFSINKVFFEKLGTYDDGFDTWGGENIELSLKTWMCGGTLEIIPCSRVGHIFRKWSPYEWSGSDVVRRNNIRLAEVWLDEYAQFFHDRYGGHLIPYGDVSKRKELRRSLGCKSFKWFRDNICPELSLPLASGRIINLAYNRKFCLDAPGDKENYFKPVGVYACHEYGGNQYWMYTKQGEIRRDHACLDFSDVEIVLYPCHGEKGNQYWKYKKLKLIHGGSYNRCLSLNGEGLGLVMEKCDSKSISQKWILEKYNASRI